MSVPLVIPALPPPPTLTPAVCLRGLHARRLRELRDVLVPARGHDAGVWSRWAAVNFTKQRMGAWFERERAAVEGAATHIPPGRAACLWMGAELVQSLGWQLDHTPALCHQPAEFAGITLKLEAVLEHWCREVEEALDRVGWRDLSEEQRRTLLECTGEEPHHVT